MNFWKTLDKTDKSEYNILVSNAQYYHFGGLSIMKRVISLVLALVLVLSLAVMICSCGEKAECDTCGEEKYVKDMTKVMELGDMVVYVCNDCQKEVDDALDGIGDLFD